MGSISTLSVRKTYLKAGDALNANGYSKSSEEKFSEQVWLLVVIAKLLVWTSTKVTLQ